MLAKTGPNGEPMATPSIFGRSIYRQKESGSSWWQIACVYKFYSFVNLKIVFPNTRCVKSFHDRT